MDNDEGDTIPCMFSFCMQFVDISSRQSVALDDVAFSWFMDNNEGEADLSACGFCPDDCIDDVPSLFSVFDWLSSFIGGTDMTSFFLSTSKHPKKCGNSGLVWRFIYLVRKSKFGDDAMCLSLSCCCVAFAPSFLYSCDIFPLDGILMYDV